MVGASTPSPSLFAPSPPFRPHRHHQPHLQRAPRAPPVCCQPRPPVGRALVNVVTFGRSLHGRTPLGGFPQDEGAPAGLIPSHRHRATRPGSDHRRTRHPAPLVLRAVGFARYQGLRTDGELTSRTAIPRSQLVTPAGVAAAGATPASSWHRVRRCHCTGVALPGMVATRTPAVDPTPRSPPSSGLLPTRA